MDDPRLGASIARGTHGDIVLVGFPHQHGYPQAIVSLEDAPDCARRFLKRVGPTYNPEYDMMASCTVSDYGNLFLEDQLPADMPLPGLLAKLQSRCASIRQKGSSYFLISGIRDVLESLEGPCCILQDQALPLDQPVPSDFPAARFQSTYRLWQLIDEQKFTVLCLDLRILKRDAFPGAEGQRPEGAQSAELLEWMLLAGCRGVSVAVWGFDPRQEDYVSGLLLCNCLYAMALGRSNPGSWLIRPESR